MSEKMSPAERKRIAEYLREVHIAVGGCGLGRNQEMALLLAAALIDPPEPPGTKGTVRVRIAVVMRADGKWHACGGFDVSPAEAEMYARDGSSVEDVSPDRLTWVEASVPLPEPPAVVEGTTVTP